MYSMTAFTRQQTEQSWGDVTWEIRSVNHRYLDVGFNLPESLSGLQDDLRVVLREKLARGKVDVNLRVRWQHKDEGKLAVDEAVLNQLKNIINQLNQRLGDGISVSPLDMVSLMRWPGVIQTPEVDMAQVKPVMLKLFNQAIGELSEVRQREGCRLRDFIAQRLEEMKGRLAQVRGLLPAALKTQKDKLNQRVTELLDDQNTPLDEGRFDQELAYLVQKADVTEELDRLEVHIAEVGLILDRKDAVGRRLDFLMQELNREANTLSAKAVVTDITRAAVDMKVLIEQMREQVQNIQ